MEGIPAGPAVVRAGPEVVCAMLETVRAGPEVVPVMLAVVACGVEGIPVDLDTIPRMPEVVAGV